MLKLTDSIWRRTLLANLTSAVKGRTRRRKSRSRLAVEPCEARVLPSGSPPVAGDGYVATVHDQSVIDGSLSMISFDPESDPLTRSVVSGPSNGTLLSFDSATGTFEYEPDAGFVGEDEFTYEVSDGTSTTQGTFRIDVTNTVPNAGDLWSQTVHDTPLNDGTISMLIYDLENDPVTVIKVSDPSSGTISNFDPATGSFTYTPDPGFSGEDTFTYALSDGLETSVPATFTIYVEGDLDINATLEVRVGTSWGSYLSDNDFLSMSAEGVAKYQTYVPFDIVGSFDSVGNHSHIYKLLYWSLSNPTQVNEWQVTPGAISGYMSVPTADLTTVGVGAALFDVTLGQIVAQAEKQEAVVEFDLGSAFYDRLSGGTQEKIKDYLADQTDELTDDFFDSLTGNIPTIAQRWGKSEFDVGQRLDDMRDRVKYNYRKQVESVFNRLEGEVAGKLVIRFATSDPTVVKLQAFVDKLPDAIDNGVAEALGNDWFDHLDQMIDIDYVGTVGFINEDAFGDFLDNQDLSKIDELFDAHFYGPSVSVNVPIKFSSAAGPVDGYFQVGVSGVKVDGIEKLSGTLNLSTSPGGNIPGLGGLQFFFMRLSGQWDPNTDEWVFGAGAEYQY